MGPNPRRTRLSDSSLKVAWYSKDARENLAHKLPSTASDRTANPAVHYTVRSSRRRLYLGTERTGIAALDCTGMPSLISVKLYRDQIAPLLLAGEEPLHAENVQGFVAANRIERRTVDRFAPLPQPIRARLERCDGEIRADTRNALERIIDATEFPTIDLDPLFGSVGHGAIGSAAQTFRSGAGQATNRRAHGDQHAARTGRRRYHETVAQTCRSIPPGDYGCQIPAALAAARQTDRRLRRRVPDGIRHRIPVRGRRATARRRTYSPAGSVTAMSQHARNFYAGLAKQACKQTGPREGTSGGRSRRYSRLWQRAAPGDH